jgi:thioredoxin 1
MEEFTSLVSKYPNLPIIVDFGASWCGPCRSIAPHFANLASMYGDKAIFCKVDTDESKSLSQAANVTALPTFVFYRHGHEVDRMRGANQNGLDQKVQAAVANSASSSSLSSSPSSSSSSSGESKEEDTTVDLSLITKYESTSNLRKALKKIESYNAIFNQGNGSMSLSSDDMNHVEHLVETLSKSNMWHASTIHAPEIQQIQTMLLKWPFDYCLPVIDIARVVVLHPDGLVAMDQHCRTMMWTFAQHAMSVNDDPESQARVGSKTSASPNGSIALKCLANTISMCTAQRRSISTIHDRIVRVCMSNVKNNDRRTREALTSLMLNSTLNILMFGEHTEINMGAWIGVISVLLHQEGKCKDATGMLVVKKCLSALSSIGKHAPATYNQWLQLGNAVTTIKSSDFGINQLKRKLLDTIATLAKRQNSGMSSAKPIPNPWA